MHMDRTRGRDVGEELVLDIFGGFLEKKVSRRTSETVG